MATANDFIGTWKLLNCEHRLEDGSTIHPFGRNAVGILIYTAEGYMSGCLMNPDRPRFKSSELLSGSPEEQAQAMAGYLHYGGRFQVEPDRVIHSVETSLFPNWVGSRQQRFYRFDQNQLELRSAPYVANGIRQTAYLHWERVSR